MDIKISAMNGDSVDIVISNVLLESHAEIKEACESMVRASGFSKYTLTIRAGSQPAMAEAVTALCPELSLHYLPRYMLQNLGHILKNLPKQPRPVIFPELPLQFLNHEHHAYVLVGAHTYIKATGTPISYNLLKRLYASDLRRLCLIVRRKLVC